MDPPRRALNQLSPAHRGPATKRVAAIATIRIPAIAELHEAPSFSENPNTQGDTINQRPATTLKALATLSRCA
jgi:hypothetical protein